MNPQPLIAVADVEASSSWYHRQLDCQGGPGGRANERLVSHGQRVLQLHHWDAHEHPHLGDPNQKPYGNGVLLWFQIADFDRAVDRARELDAAILEEPHVNADARHRECWIRDPDGYVVVLASAYGDVGPGGTQDS